MITALMAIVIGSLIGLTAAIPGIHPSVLLVGLMPVLGMGGTTGAITVCAATGSALGASVLAKTFHPTNASTIGAATPEQKMAYRGLGIKAINVQLSASWTGLFIVMALTFPIVVVVASNPPGFIQGFLTAIKPLVPFLILGLIAVMMIQAKNKVATLIITALAGLLGFYALNLPAMQGNSFALSPLLAGIFSIPALALVAFSAGTSAKFPNQRPDKRSTFQPCEWTVVGALGGTVTALTAGLGSGAAVSPFAEHVKEEEYLGMHTAAEAANNAFAILLFVVAGATRSSSAVTLQQSLANPGVITGIILMMAVLMGLWVSTKFCQASLQSYASMVSSVPPRVVALAVLALVLGFVGYETGFAGFMIAGVATSLGLAARANCVPNQALVAVLTGPVVLYHLGLSGYLAQLLHITH